MTTDSFPRLIARTLNFQLGLPKGFVVSPDGERVVFLRSDGPTSRNQALWVYDVPTGLERKIAEPADLLSSDETLTPEERARRERMRVATSGIVAFSTDKDVTVAAFALSSRLFVADLRGTAGARELTVDGPVVDPRLDPSGTRIAYADGRALHVVDQAGGDRIVVGPGPDEPTTVVWGLAEFVAAEELDRDRGFWWAPDGRSLLVARYDESDVLVWYIADPANPEREPVAMRYPQAGTANAVVSLHAVQLTGQVVDLDWRSDRDLDGVRLEYLAEVTWADGDPLLTLLTRDQRRMEFRSVDLASGATTPVRGFTDDCWVELLPGTPHRLADGRLLHAVDDGDTRRLALDGVAFSPEGLQVRAVLDVGDDGVLASVVPAVASVSVATLGFDGAVRLHSDPAGTATGVASGGVQVVQHRSLHDTTIATSVTRDGLSVGSIAGLNDSPPITLNVETMQVGSRDYPTSVIFPNGHVPGSRRLPVLMDPYGGPHGQRVINTAHAYLTSQWLADQGFVVIVADGRGMAGRGPAWDRLAKNDFIGTIDDQAEVVQEVAKRFPDDIDDTRVAIRGWSFGGYIALAGVLRRPDVFAAAIAGAPVTDQRLYDTCYSERYFGDPRTANDVYDANDLTLLAADLDKPLMLIHGLADDNVLIAHTLRMSSALLAAGRPHEVLPLSGMTHMANSETVAENLLVLQVDFLRRALDLA